MAIINLDQAPIKLNAIELQNVHASLGGIFDILSLHYNHSLLQEVYNIVGSADIIGNPIGLVNTLGTGFRDFFYEPAQGFVRGPISGGKGIIKGTGSLLKNTVKGTFNSVSKITNSFATGLTILSQDKEFIKNREQSNTQKPANVV